METPEGHQKSIFNTSKVKKTKIYIKDLSDNVCKLNTKPKISSKSMFNTSKVKRSQTCLWRLHGGVCRLNPKSIKKLSAHQIYQSGRTFFQKKYV
jgi:hypothetical protein